MKTSKPIPVSTRPDSLKEKALIWFLRLIIWLGQLMMSFERFNLGQMRPLWAVGFYVLWFRVGLSLLLIPLLELKLGFYLLIAVYAFRFILMAYGLICIRRSFANQPDKRWVRLLTLSLVSLDVAIAFFVPVLMVYVMIH